MAEEFTKDARCVDCGIGSVVDIRMDEFNALVGVSNMARGPYDNGSYVCGRRKFNSTCIRAYGNGQKRIKEDA